MSVEDRLASLMLIWQERLESGREPVIGELCRDCPELADELQRRVAVMQKIIALDHTHSSPSFTEKSSSENSPTVISDEPKDANSPEVTRDREARYPPDVPGYEVIKELGRGGMGVVYLARDLSLQRVVALKMVLSGEYASTVVLNRFQSEVEAVARLQHPGVVQIHDVGKVEGVPFCTLEYCSGGSLAALLRQGPLSSRQAAELLYQLATTMHAVHRHGIIHRDLKPGNILLQQTSASSPTNEHDLGGPSEFGSAGILSWTLPGGLVPKISDFGLARRLDLNDGQTRTGELVGTPAYMSPEQAAGRSDKINPATDVYALGVIMYECLTGHSPYRAATFVDTLEMVLNRDPIPPRKLQPTIPRDLDTICLKCLEKDPDRRYATALELSEDLHRFLRHEIIHARRASLREHAVKWVRRHPTAAAILALSGIATVAILGLAFWFSARLVEQRSEIRLAKLQSAAHQELADTREFHAMLTQVRQRRADPTPGWKWDNLADLARIVQLKPAIERGFELRSEAVAALAAFDMRQETILAKGLTASCVMWNPNERFVALAERRDVMFMVDPVVRFIDPSSGTTLRELKFPAQNLKGLSLAKGIELEPDGARAIRFSPDSRWFAVGSRSGSLHIWDLNSTSRVPISVKAHQNPVSSIVFDKTGSSLFSASRDDRTISRWTLGDSIERPAATRKLAHAVNGVSLHPTDGQVAISTSSGDFYNLAPETLQDDRPPIKFDHRITQYMPDGRSFLALDDTINVCSWEHPKLLKSLTDPDNPQSSQSGIISDLVASPNGRFIASASAESKHVRLWETCSGRLLSDLAIAGGGVSLAFSADSCQLAVTADRQSFVYQLSDVEGQAELAAYLPIVRTFGLHPSGKRLWSIAGSNDQLGQLNFWSLPQTKVTEPSQVQPLAHFRLNVFHQVAFHPSEPLVAVVVSDQVEFWHLNGTPGARKSIALNNASECALDWDLEGRLWIADGDEVFGWDMAQPQPIFHWKNLTAQTTGLAQIYTLTVERGQAIAGGRDGQAYILNAERPNELPRIVRLADAPIRCCASIPDKTRKLVAMGSNNGKLSVLDVDAQRRLSELVPHRDRIESMDWRSDGLLATAGNDRMLRLSWWKSDHFEDWFEVKLPRPIRQLRFHPDGQSLLFVMDRESSIRVWNLSTIHDRLRGLRLD